MVKCDRCRSPSRSRRLHECLACCEGQTGFSSPVSPGLGTETADRLPSHPTQPNPLPPPSPSKRDWAHRLTPQIRARYLQPVSWAVGLLVLAHPAITLEQLARDGCVVRILIERACRLDFLGVLVPPCVTQPSAWRRANGGRWTAHGLRSPGFPCSGPGSTPSSRSPTAADRR